MIPKEIPRVQINIKIRRMCVILMCLPALQCIHNLICISQRAERESGMCRENRKGKEINWRLSFFLLLLYYCVYRSVSLTERSSVYHHHRPLACSSFFFPFLPQLLKQQYIFLSTLYSPLFSLSSGLHLFISCSRKKRVAIKKLFPH